MSSQVIVFAQVTKKLAEKYTSKQVYLVDVNHNVELLKKGSFSLNYSPVSGVCYGSRKLIIQSLCDNISGDTRYGPIIGEPIKMNEWPYGKNKKFENGLKKLKEIKVEENDIKKIDATHIALRSAYEEINKTCFELKSGEQFTSEDFEKIINKCTNFGSEWRKKQNYPDFLEYCVGVSEKTIGLIADLKWNKGTEENPDWQTGYNDIVRIMTKYCEPPSRINILCDPYGAIMYLIDGDSKDPEPALKSFVQAITGKNNEVLKKIKARFEKTVEIVIDCEVDDILATKIFALVKSITNSLHMPKLTCFIADPNQLAEKKSHPYTKMIADYVEKMVELEFFSKESTIIYDAELTNFPKLSVWEKIIF